METFWGEAAPTSARNNLKTTLSSLRRTFRDAGLAPDDILAVDRDAVVWIAPVLTDVREFQRCSPAIDTERARALEWYRGELLPGDFAEWAVELRERLSVRFETHLRRELSASGSPGVAERLLALDPFSDDAYCALVEAALRTGDRRAARTTYRRYCASLADIGAAPPPALAERMAAETSRDFGRPPSDFWGRSAEYAELARAFDEDGARVAIVCGISGIGKTAFAREAARRRADWTVRIHDVTAHDLDDDGGALRALAARPERLIVCAQPEFALRASDSLPEAPRIELAPLAYDEFALAMRRRLAIEDTAAIDALWRRSHGHPTVAASLADRLAKAKSAVTPESVARVPLPRELDERFERQVRELGADCATIATFVALEDSLDDADLVAVLGWDAERVGRARERLRLLGAGEPFCMQAMSRALGPADRSVMRTDIAGRLRRRGTPDADLRVAAHEIELDRPLEAASAFLRAADAFARRLVWEKAESAARAGIDILETDASGEHVRDALRHLHLLAASALVRRGSYRSAVRALDAVVEISASPEHARVRVEALIGMGEALLSMHMIEAAWLVARRALDDSANLGDAVVELHARELVTCLLRERFAYDEALASARDGYERAMNVREWALAASFANVAVDLYRRDMRFDDCFRWAPHQLEAATLAGPIAEAKAHYTFGTVMFVVNRAGEALAAFARALVLVEAGSADARSRTPAEKMAWMVRHGRAHVLAAVERYDEAVAESEWLLYSSWTAQSPLWLWRAAALAVDARLGRGGAEDLAAARAIVDRLPIGSPDDPFTALEALARARVAAAGGDSDAAMLLRRAFAVLEAARSHVIDQVYPYYFQLAASARGIDDALAARATETGGEIRTRVMRAAGALWGRSATVASA